MKKVQFSPNKALVATAIASAIGASGQAQALDVTLSGQVNRIVNLLDDGVDNEVLFQDCACTGTRFRIIGHQDLGNGYSTGSNIELQFQSNATFATNIQTPDGQVVGPSSSNGALRKADAYIGTPFGKISLGQGDGASNGTSETDLSDTWIASYNAPSGPGSIALRVEGTNEISDQTVSSITSQYDGFTRNDRIRYDTPSFGGLKFAGSVGNSFQEVAARYSGDAGGVSISAALGFATNDDGVDRFMGSASLLHSSGFNLTWSFGTQDTDNDIDALGNETDAFTTYGKVGWRFGDNFQHAVSVGGGFDTDRTFADQEGTRFDLAYINNIAKGVKLYAGLNTAQFDSPEGVDDFQDVFALFGGGRFTF